MNYAYITILMKGEGKGGVKTINVFIKTKDKNGAEDQHRTYHALEGEGGSVSNCVSKQPRVHLKCECACSEVERRHSELTVQTATGCSAILLTEHNPFCDQTPKRNNARILVHAEYCHVPPARRLHITIDHLYFKHV